MTESFKPSSNVHIRKYISHHSNSILIYLHDLEGTVGCVEELELFDGPLRNRVEGGTTPAPLHQTDGLCCKHTTRTFSDKTTKQEIMQLKQLQREISAVQPAYKYTFRKFNNSL